MITTHKYRGAFPRSMESELDVLVVGGGVIGCACARELSRYELKVTLLEKTSDVCAGASRANSGVVHSGIYSHPDSLKAELCVEGNNLFSNWTEELGVKFNRIGKLVVARDEDEIKELEKLKEVGGKNNVSGLRIVFEDELKELEPNIRAKYGLWVPSAGIVSPYQLTIALADNAKANGLQIFLDSEVRDITQEEKQFIVKTKNMTFRTRYVINCAGLDCDAVAKMAGIDKYQVYPCRGEYLILDKSLSHLINHLIYPPPENGSGGLGVHLTPTMEGNILIGPTAEYIDEKGDTRTTKAGMDKLLLGASRFIGELPKDANIKSYSGIRCKLTQKGCETSGDFVIEEVENFINLMGIESPGLSASPAIARKVLNIIHAKEDLKPKSDFKKRRGQIRFHKLDLEGKSRSIEHNPKHGHLICRCENVTEQEIIDVLNNPLGIQHLAGLKYRCRATMGRCQGGFCKPRIINLIEELYDPNVEDITLHGKGSHLFVGRTKDLRKNESEKS
jgi:glycerol-3-phosphate dehydrogenase